MRNVNSRISVVALSAQSQWRSSWTGRIILTALLVAASALALMPEPYLRAPHRGHDVPLPTAAATSEPAPSGSLLPDLANSGEIR